MRDEREVNEEDVRVTDVDEVTEVTPYKYTITAYGADYPVDGLVQRLRSDDVLIPTFSPEVSAKVGRGRKDRIVGFQRDFVWSKDKMDRFVESLLLGLSVPGIFGSPAVSVGHADLPGSGGQ